MQAEKAADALSHGSESGQQQQSPEPETQLLLNALSEAMYGLAQTGMVRVTQLARAPQLLACWALELLEEQACQVHGPFSCVASPIGVYGLRRGCVFQFSL